MSLLDIPNYVTLVLDFVLLAVKLFALISALTFSAEHYNAAGKWTKPGWTILLAVAVVVQVALLGIMIINLALTIAAFVYLADVRPALASLRRR